MQYPYLAGLPRSCDRPAVPDCLMAGISNSARRQFQRKEVDPRVETGTKLQHSQTVANSQRLSLVAASYVNTTTAR